MNNVPPYGFRKGLLLWGAFDLVSLGVVIARSAYALGHPVALGFALLTYLGIKHVLMTRYKLGSLLLFIEAAFFTLLALVAYLYGARVLLPFREAYPMILFLGMLSFVWALAQTAKVKLCKVKRETKS